MVTKPWGEGRRGTCGAGTPSLSAPSFPLPGWRVPHLWTGLEGYVIVCRGSYPTILTPRTVYRFSLFVRHVQSCDDDSKIEPRVSQYVTRQHCQLLSFDDTLSL